MSEDSIPLDQLGSSGGDDKRRDQWGRYMVLPPEGPKPVGYTRATTIAKTLDDGGGLAPWKAAMTVTGVMRDRGLRASWEALIAEYGDPWYAGPESKKKTKRLVEESAKAGGAEVRKDQGVALHAITALIDAGGTARHLTPETQADLDAYHAALAAAGVEFHPQYVETMVVLDEPKVAGQFDRLAYVRGFDLPMIADLKTGSSLDYSWHSFCVQCSIYSRGDNVYTQGDAADGSQDRRDRMPEVDQSLGLVIWLPVGEARCELYVIDLDEGWQGFQLSMAAREWLRQKGLASELGTFVPTPAPPEPSALDQLRVWLQQRVDNIGAEGASARTDLARSWPVGVPTLKRSTAHTVEQLAAIEGVLDVVEGRAWITYRPPRPTAVDEATAMEHLLHGFPGAQGASA